MVLQQVFSPKSIILDLQSTEKDELFEEMLEAVVAVQPDIDRSEALHALRERESKMSTGIMHSVAGQSASAAPVLTMRRLTVPPFTMSLCWWAMRGTTRST